MHWVVIDGFHSDSEGVVVLIYNICPSLVCRDSLHTWYTADHLVTEVLLVSVVSLEVQKRLYPVYSTSVNTTGVIKQGLFFVSEYQLSVHCLKKIPHLIKLIRLIGAWLIFYIAKHSSVCRGKDTTDLQGGKVPVCVQASHQAQEAEDGRKV